jgi:hypothetical protein
MVFHSAGTPMVPATSAAAVDRSCERFAPNVHLVTKSRAGIQVPDALWTKPPPNEPLRF